MLLSSQPLLGSRSAPRRIKDGWGMYTLAIGTNYLLQSAIQCTYIHTVCVCMITFSGIVLLLWDCWLKVRLSGKHHQSNRPRAAATMPRLTFPLAMHHYQVPPCGSTQTTRGYSYRLQTASQATGKEWYWGRVLLHGRADGKITRITLQTSLPTPGAFLPSFVQKQPRWMFL